MKKLKICLLENKSILFQKLFSNKLSEENFLFFNLFSDPVSREGTMDGHHSIYFLGLLPGMFLLLLITETYFC